MKIVLDTNVLVSALLWQGLPHRLLCLIEQGSLTLCLTPDLLEELAAVLRRPKFASRLNRLNTSEEELIAGVIALAQLHPSRNISPVIQRDPDDDKVLACAKFSGAEYIVTGDFHLLDLRCWEGISILTPRQFLDLIQHFGKH